uniref:Uncharacterized protein n=1 Tax=Anguilla anguilla TaxID=7936 RepID=A0A0E9UNC8_ANGAN
MLIEEETNSHLTHILRFLKS